jgi:hypothetical protein
MRSIPHFFGNPAGMLVHPLQERDRGSPAFGEGRVQDRGDFGDDLVPMLTPFGCEGVEKRDP